MDDLKPIPCAKCQDTFTRTYFDKIADKYPQLPPRTCQKCASPMLRRLRAREMRRPSLTEHDITTLAAAGCSDVSRGARNLLDEYRLRPFPIPYDAWLTDDAPGRYYLDDARVVNLRIDDDRNRTLIGIAAAHFSASGRHHPRPQHVSSLTLALHALLCVYRKDTELQKRVISRNPRLDAHLALTARGEKLDDEWLS